MNTNTVQMMSKKNSCGNTFKPSSAELLLAMLRRELDYIVINTLHS